MYTVLVCDDEKDIVSALKIYLTSDGYDVLCAYNGDEALELMEHNTVHLVLMDIMMPKTDGLTALSLLREKYNTPVIFTTAKSEDSDIVLGLNLGADDYITKPLIRWSCWHGSVPSCGGTPPSAQPRSRRKTSLPPAA